jgi:Spy/CpxP family protein refolding chaperone
MQNNYKGGKNMKKQSIIVCLLTFLFIGIFSMACYAEGYCKGKKHDQGHGHGVENKVFHKFHLAISNEVELGLSEEQYEKIKTLKINTKKDLIIKRAEIDVLKIDIKAKLWEDTIDKKGINKLIDKKYEIKKEKAKALVDTYAKFNNILTEEQKKTLETIIRQRHKK